MLVKSVVNGLFDIGVRVGGSGEDGFCWKIIGLFFLLGGFPPMSNHFRPMIFLVIENRFNLFWDELFLVDNLLILFLFVFRILKFFYFVHHTKIFSLFLFVWLA